MKRQIVNIINFIRAVEPRRPMNLVEPVVKQIEEMSKRGLRGTFLLQYDALIRPEYTDLLKALDPEQFEIGVWFEVVQPQVEDAGLTWTGRFPWDWHAHCGFSVGYTKPEREKLVDVLFERFKAEFGDYPRVFGSWFFDSHTIRYIADKYGLDAICNCKEQYGTDGYTLWGGYYGQGYYPSRTNVFMPAQTENERIDAPLFRMLGSDPVYQYDFGMDVSTGATAWQGVVTLEPVYTGNEGGGGSPRWVDWYMKENFNGDCLTFGYAQAGQENSFGWPAMEKGLLYQFDLLEKLQSEGKLTVEPLGETGRWFKETYKDTPASAITAHDAFDDKEKNSVWYSSRNYRVNLFADHGRMRIRDMHVFRESYPDPFEDRVCEANEAKYETLPVIDGNRMSGNGVLAGGYIEPLSGADWTAGKMTFSDLGNGEARVSYGKVTVTLRPDGLSIESDEDFTVTYRMGLAEGHVPSVTARTDTSLALDYHGAEYGISVTKGKVRNNVTFASDGGKLDIRVRNGAE